MLAEVSLWNTELSQAEQTAYWNEALFRVSSLPGVERAHHDAGLDLLAGLEHHPGGAAASGLDMRDARLGADLDPEREGAVGDRIGDRCPSPRAP